MVDFDRIECLRKEKGWSRREFARRLNVTEGALRNWMAVNKVQDDRLFNIAEILDTTVDYLRGETGLREKAKAPFEKQMEQALRDLGVIVSDGKIDSARLDHIKRLAIAYDVIDGGGVTKEQ